MTITPNVSALRLIIALLISTLLGSCGTSDNKTQAQNGAGIAFQLKWPVAKIVGSAPAGVTKVRMSVSGSDMTTMSNDFDSAAGTGSITNVPVGSGRTITFQGLNASSVITHLATKSNVTLAAGQVYNCGTVTMTIVPDSGATAPTAPSGLSATAASASQINLAWIDNSNNETGFKIERKTGTNGTYTQISTAATNAISYNDTGLTASTAYYYRVRATNSNGDSAYTAEANATTLAPVETAPAAPTGLSATAISSTQINLAWTDNSTNETGFKIERKTGASGIYAEISTSATNATTYNDTGLIASTTYYYRIRSSNGVGNSGYAIETSATTTMTPPTAPSGLGTNVASSTQINLAWTDNSNNEFGFKIERKTGAGGTYAEIGTVTTNVTSYNDTGLTASTTYYYRVRATNSAGDSGYTTEANATTSAVVALTYSISGTITSGGSALVAATVTLSGSGSTPVTTGSSGNYSFSGAQNGSYTLTPSMTGYTFSPATLPVTVNGANLTGQNFTATAIPPTAPSGLSTTAASSSQINLSWIDNSNNESGFKIERKTGAGGTFAQIGTAAANTISYNDTTGLAAWTSYYYRVRAANSTAGDSGYSGEASDITQPAATTTKTALYIKLRDGLPGIDPVTNPLGNLNVDGLQFDLSGITIALEGPSIDAAQTYTAFVSALNSVIAATPKAAGLSAAVGTTFTEINTVSASGYYIVITDSFGRSFANNTFTHSTASTASFIELGNFSTSAPATLIDTTTGMVLLKVAGSTYTMGDTFGDGFSGELPTHQVTVGDFYIGKYEVTQGQWQAVMGSNPSYFSSCGTTCPVEQVSWDDIQTFITTLNQRSGKSYRLPTEAEWEYAARSGGKSEKYSGSSDVNAVAWYTTNSSGTTHPAGQKQANGLGLYDMSGNAWEWVNDWYGSYSSTVQTNPTGPTSGSYRVTRGGGWNHDATYARASYRNNNTPDLRAKTVGFRLAAPVQ